MNIKIFQIYHKDEHIPHLVPGFTPYDNSENLSPNEREYPLLKKCDEIARRERLDLWGAVTWKWIMKFHVTSDRIFDHINRNSGYDVYFFSPWPSHVPLMYNVWEQGQWCHEHMLTIVEDIFPRIGLKKDLIYQPMDRTDIVFGSNCIATPKFWKHYFSFADQFVNCIPELPPNIRELYEGDTGYTDSTINYFSFIQERLLSTFLSINKKHFKVLPFQDNEDLLTPDLCRVGLLKTLALERQDPALLEAWRLERNKFKSNVYPNTFDWAEQWIPRYKQK